MASDSPPIHAVIGRRYVLSDQLGKGGMGDVYRAADRLTGQTVALKLVNDPSHESDSTPRQQHTRVALAREFKALATLRHPNVIGVLDYGFDTYDSPYFTMELLENAHTVLEAALGQPLPVKIDFILQMLQALSYVHRRGILHRDLKPPNALVTAGQVKVLDFGIAAAKDHAPETEISGTLRYMAPEVLQDMGSSIEADLYAVGVMAYEMIGGVHPFKAEDNTTMIMHMLSHEPDYTLLDVPASAQSVIQRLMNKTPQNRYHSAEDAIGALCEALALPVPVESVEIRESYLQSAQFVGRDVELSQLAMAFSQAAERQGSAWLVAGESGVGKSRLLEELRILALVQGALVLRGQAASEPSTPFQVWRGVLRWLALVTPLSDAEVRRLSAVIPDLPALLGKKVETYHTVSPDLAPQTLQTQLVSLVEDLFSRQQQPIVVILEDLHWAGRESLLLLDRLTRIAHDAPLLIIASYRDDERADLPALLPEMRLLKLGRLNHNHIAELSVAMLGESGRQPHIVQYLHHETEGNVFFLVEIVRALAEEAGRLDNVRDTPARANFFAGGIDRLLQRRLSRVPARSLELLKIAAVIGRQIDLKVIQALHDAASVETADQWLTACANAAILEVEDGEWRFMHDKLRERLLAELTDSDYRALHAKAAAAIETAYPGSTEKIAALAYHWGKAGDTEREAHYTALAGKQALNSTAFHDAVRFLERATALSQPEPTEDYLQQRLAYLTQDLGEAYFGLGAYAEANALYQKSLQIFEAINDRLGIARAQGDLAELYYALGDYQMAERLFRESLRLSETVGDRLGAAWLRGQLGQTVYMMGDYREAQRLYRQSLLICKEIGDQPGIAGALAQLGSIAHSAGQYAEAQRFAEESLSIYETVSDKHGLAVAYNLLGSVALAHDAHAEAWQRYKQGLAIAADIRAVPAALDILDGIAALLVRQGETERALDLLCVIVVHPATQKQRQAKAESLLALLESELSSDTIAAAQARSKGQKLELVIAQILSS